MISSRRSFATNCAHFIAYCEVGFLLSTDAFIVFCHPIDLVNEIQRTFYAARLVNSDIYTVQEWANVQLLAVRKCAFRLTSPHACQETLHNRPRS